VLALLSVLFWSSTRKTAADSEAERVAHGTSLSSPSDGERVPPSSSDSELLSSSSTRSAQVAPTASTHKIDRDHDLHGIVLDSASQPVVGARVEIRQSESDGYTFPDQVRDGAPTRTETKTAETVTDAEGRFAVALPIGRPHSLEVSAAGFALERMDDRFAGEFVRVCLRHGASLLGRVTRTDDGAPVAGVEIEIAAAGRNPPRLPKIVLVTDALGGYRVDGLAPIRRFVHLVPTVEVPVKMQSRMLELTEGEMRKVDFSVELSRTVPLRGYVLDASTKAPIAGAQVLAFFSVIETDETGRYAFQGAAREDARGVSARAVGYEMQHKSFSPSRDVEFPERVDFELRPTRTARGRVLDVEGKPVPDAYVAVVTLPPADETGHAEGYWSRKSPRVSEAAWHFAHSAGDGSFEVAGVSPDANCSLDVREATCALIARKPGFGTQTYFFPPRATDTPRIELGDVVMHPMSVVRGTVVDDRGQGVRDRTVCFSRVTQIGPETCTPHEATFAEFEWQRTARSDDLGRFSFADVSSGTYCFPLALNTGTTPVGMAQAVEVEEGATVDGLRLVVPGSLTIEGRVVDASGHAIPNAWLFAQPLLPSVDAGVPPRLGFESEHAETDAHGRFKISFLAAGEHRISVYPSLLNTLSEQRITFPPKQLSGIQAGTRDLEIRLDPTSWIRGRVVAPGGAGAPQYWVTATIRGDGHVTGGMTDGDGRFQFAIAPDEIVDLVARRQWSPDLEPSELARSAKLEGVSAGETDVILQLH
jgi:protocatechuate 3,4-dioxygenase beta subunit